MQSFIFLITKTVSRTCNSRNGHFLISYLPWLIAYQFIDTLFQQLQRTDTYQAFISCILSLHIHMLFRKCCFNTSVAWSSAIVVKYSVAILRNTVPVKLSFNRNQASLILPLMFTACFMSCGNMHQHAIWATCMHGMTLPFAHHAVNEIWIFKIVLCFMFWISQPASLFVLPVVCCWC